MPDYTTLVSLFLTIGTIAWIGYDRVTAAKHLGSQTVENLAVAAEKLVNTSQAMYARQFATLELELTTLRQRVAELEKELRRYRQCNIPDCPYKFDAQF